MEGGFQKVFFVVYFCFEFLMISGFIILRLTVSMKKISVTCTPCSHFTGVQKKGISRRKEDLEYGYFYYYCALQFTKWRSYKPLLHDFELICHIRETQYFIQYKQPESVTKKSHFVFQSSAFPKIYNKDRIRPGCLIDRKALLFLYDTLHSTVPSPMNTMQELVRSSSEFSLRH